LLTENGIEPVVVELNLQTVRELQAQGVSALLGDATDPAVLDAAGVRGAVALIITSAGMQGTAEVIRAARELNPALQIIARSIYLREVPELRKAGAAAVFSGEGEIALNMTEFMLRRLGATEEQIDRERERVRNELPVLHETGGEHADTSRL